MLLKDINIVKKFFKTLYIRRLSNDFNLINYNKIYIEKNKLFIELNTTWGYIYIVLLNSYPFSTPMFYIKNKSFNILDKFFTLDIKNIIVDFSGEKYIDFKTYCYNKYSNYNDINIWIEEWDSFIYNWIPSKLLYECLKHILSINKLSVNNYIPLKLELIC